MSGQMVRFIFIKSSCPSLGRDITNHENRANRTVSLELHFRAKNRRIRNIPFPYEGFYIEELHVEGIHGGKGIIKMEKVEEILG